MTFGMTFGDAQLTFGDAVADVVAGVTLLVFGGVALFILWALLEALFDAWEDRGE